MKEKLTSTPVIVALEWKLSFELMCDASTFAVGAMLGQRKRNVLHIIYYANKTLTNTQINYTTTKKEMLAVIFAFDKFRSTDWFKDDSLYRPHNFKIFSREEGC